MLILTRDPLIRHLSALVVAPITTTIRDTESQVRLSQVDGMREECSINLDNIQAVPSNRLGPLITRLSGDKMRDVKDAISYALGFSLIERLP